MQVWDELVEVSSDLISVLSIFKLSHAPGLVLEFQARQQQGGLTVNVLRMQVWDEHVEVTSDLMLTHFMFSLPLDAPASFATHLVSLRWVLRFEFTTSAAKPAGWLSGGSTPEQIVWALPVLVRPPVAVA